METLSPKTETFCAVFGRSHTAASMPAFGSTSCSFSLYVSLAKVSSRPRLSSLTTTFLFFFTLAYFCRARKCLIVSLRALRFGEGESIFSFNREFFFFPLPVFLVECSSRFVCFTFPLFFFLFY